jgi:hypothetical protein
MYRPSCLIEAYFSPESTGWYMLGCWLSIYSIKAPFFATVAAWRLRNEWQFLRIDSVARQSHSAAKDRCRGSKICVRHCTGFHQQNSSDQVQRVNFWQTYSQSARVQDSAKNCWVSWHCGPVLNLQEETYFLRIHPLDPEDN